MTEGFGTSYEVMGVQFDLGATLQKGNLTAEEYGYFQARLDLPEQVKKDLKEVGKQYGKGKTGKEYVSMKLLTVLKGYQDTLPEIEKALVGLQVKTFLDIIYPEILKNSWSHEAYRQQRVTFFQKKYHPTFQRNVDIGKSNQEFSRLVAQANRVALENWPKYLTYYPKINMDCFTDPQLVKKYAGQKLLDLDNEVIVSSSQTGKKTRTRNHVYREGVIPSETVKVAVGGKTYYLPAEGKEKLLSKQELQIFTEYYDDVLTELEKLYLPKEQIQVMQKCLSQKRGCIRLSVVDAGAMRDILYKEHTPVNQRSPSARFHFAVKSLNPTPIGGLALSAYVVLHVQDIAYKDYPDFRYAAPTPPSKPLETPPPARDLQKQRRRKVTETKNGKTIVSRYLKKPDGSFVPVTQDQYDVFGSEVFFEDRSTYAQEHSLKSEGVFAYFLETWRPENKMKKGK